MNASRNPLSAYGRRRFKDAGVHAFIDANDGVVYQVLPWTFRAWHCGGVQADHWRVISRRSRIMMRFSRREIYD